MRAAVGWAHHQSLRPQARRFMAALQDPAAAQATRRRAVASAVHAAAFSVEHGLGDLASPTAWERVPVLGARDWEARFDRVAAGEPDVLTHEPVTVMERTSGSTGRTKLVPFTQGFLAEVRAATDPWVWDLQRVPGVRGQRSYWSISPVVQGARETAGGIRIGFEDDTQYFGPVARWAIRTMLAVPPEVARDVDMASWRTRTLRHLAAAEDLGLVSVWSPSFLTVLLEAMEAGMASLLATLRPAHQARIRHRLERGSTLAEALWPRLRLVSAWADGPAAMQLTALRRHLPRTPVQGKGLLATEGVVSIPFGGANVLAVNSHYLEFVDVDQPGDPIPAADLVPGRVYTPLLSTSAGLLRYPLRDLVECTGRLGRTPTVRFLGRADLVSDLCGEKLAESQAQAALDAAGATGAAFAMLLPDLSPARYCLAIEGVGPEDAARLARAVEASLEPSHPYRYCRDLGQLRPVEAVCITGGWATYQRLRVAEGARAGDVKPVALGRQGWLDRFVRA